MKFASILLKSMALYESMYAPSKICIFVMDYNRVRQTVSCNVTFEAIEIDRGGELPLKPIKGGFIIRYAVYRGT